ncbi:MAG TPA: hypothetical protein VJU79_01230 [Candidatus Dormibacteraeota bacterium]|nr:hypothetical protein [Candidatus Dormibacteraeota bacterium]
MRVAVLGGFRVERAGLERPLGGWQRRTAKSLTKLLAAHPQHRLHRDQILEFLWPNAEVESALNGFGKALHAARRAFEPDLLPRESSAYLRLTESMVALDTTSVTVDADEFQRSAETALGKGDITAYRSALAGYGGELLPEDRYEDWCADRRDFLAGLHLRLLFELAEVLTHGRVCDVTKARRIVHLHAATALPTGIARTSEWHRREGYLPARRTR